MKIRMPKLMLVLVTLLGSATAHSQGDNKDPEAINLLRAMDAYTASMDKFQVNVESYNDATIGDFVVVNNPSISVVTVDRSGSSHSLHSSTHDGEHTSEIYFNDGTLTLFSDKNNYYAQADVPEYLDEALMFALEEFEVETPIFDFLVLNSLEHLATEIEAVLHLSDNSPIRGVECHQVLVSGPHVDLQVWIAKGDRPVPVRTLMIYKAGDGRPRHEVFMDWDTNAQIRSSDFEFDPPRAATEIEFVTKQ